MLRSLVALLGTGLLGVAMTGCEGQTSGSGRLSAEPLLHLEDHLEQAWVDGSDVPRDTANALRWDFPEEEPAWETTGGRSAGPIPMGRPSNPPRLERIDDALRLHLGGNDSDREGPAHGVLYVDLPDLQRDEWNHVLVRVRTSDPVRRLTIAFNLSDPRKTWNGVDTILKKAEVPQVPKSSVAVFVGTEFDVIKGRGGDGEPVRKTPWGEIAWQLGGQKGFDLVAEHDAKGVAPAGDVLRELFGTEPALILVDELMNYISRARKLAPAPSATVASPRWRSERLRPCREPVCPSR